MASSVEDTTFFVVGKTVYQKPIAKDSVKFAETDFAPTAICVNTSLSLVAVGGAGTLAIYSASGKLKTTVKVRNSVRKLIWHPCGVSDACLVALTEAEVLICTCGEVVEVASFDLSRTPEAEVNIADEPLDPVSVAFGPSTADTGVLSIYIATRDGDFFGICPFVPKKFVLSSTQLKKLINFSVDNQEGAGKQLSWVSAVTRQIDSSPKTWVNEQRAFVFNAPESHVASVQGPFRLQPYPESLYGEETVDFACVDIAESILLIQATKNYVNFYLQPISLNLAWESNNGQEITALTLVNSVKVSSSSSIKKLVVPESHGLVFVETSEKLACIDYRSWRGVLAEAFTVGDVSKLPPSVVTEEPISYIYVNRSNNVLTEDQHEGTIKTWGTPGSTANDTEESYSRLPKFYGIIDSPESYIDQVRSAVSNIALRPKGILPQLKDDVESLEKLSEVSEFYNRGINDLFKQILFTEKHIEAQRNELRRQLEELANADSRKQSLEPKTVSDRVSSAWNRHEKLKSRVVALSEQLADAKNTGKPLGLAEQQWFSELDRIQNRVQEVQRRIEALRANLTAADEPATNDLSNAQVSAASEKRNEGLLAALRNKINLQSSQIRKIEQKIDAF